MISTVVELRPLAICVFRWPASPSSVLLVDGGDFLRSKDIFCTAADLRGNVVALGPSDSNRDVTLVLLLLPVESLS